MELVVARHLLGEFAATFVLEHDEVSNKIEEAALLEHPSKSTSSSDLKCFFPSPPPPLPVGER
jgi:hypothetical protein